MAVRLTVLAAVLALCRPFPYAEAAGAGGPERELEVIMLSRHPEKADSMAEMLRGCGSRVTVRPESELRNGRKVEEILKTLPQCSLLILDVSQEQSLHLVGTVLRKFFQAGGTVLCLYPWIYADRWENFLSANGIWYQPLAPMKPYFAYRSAFPGQAFVPNPRVRHRLLEKPNRLSGNFGTGTFGMIIPKDGHVIPLFVSADNSACTGVSLQENVLDRGSMIFSCVRGFMNADRNGIAPHSRQFLENLLLYVSRRTGSRVGDENSREVPEVSGDAAGANKGSLN